MLIFQRGSAFLYEVLRPKPGTITGPKAVCQYDTALWTVPVKPGHMVHWYLDSNLLETNAGALRYAGPDTGVHQLQVLVENKHGAVSSAGNFSFFISPAPRAEFSISSRDSFAFVIDTNAIGRISYQWGDGNQSSDTLHSYLSQGDYLVLQIAELGFCRDTVSRQVRIDFCPIARFAHTPFNAGHLFEDRSLFADSSFWSFGDGSPVRSAANPYHEYQLPGQYTVVLTAKDANCQDTAQLKLSQLPTGINGEEEISLTLFPNPAKGQFELHGMNILGADITLRNVAGAIVLQKSQVNLPATITLPASLPAALYLIELRWQNRVWNMHLIKE
jgi:hypothetical protein